MTQGTALDGVWGGTTTWHRRELLAGPNPEVARRQEAVDRYRRLGWAKPAIAFALGVSETTVARDLSILSRKAAS